MKSDDNNTYIGRQIGKCKIIKHTPIIHTTVIGVGLELLPHDAYLIECDCGNTFTVPTTKITRQHPKMCSQCKANGVEIIKDKRTYNSWYSMMRRCYNKEHQKYKYYGEKGVTVLEHWHVFENFFSDMGARPINMTLDRVDPYKGYSHENCKWSTAAEQRENTRKNKAKPKST